MEEKLKKLMKHEGINSTKLAEILGIQPSGISHIMSGRNNPSYDFLLKLLQRFPQINPDWLLLDKGPMYRDEIKNKNAPYTSAVASRPVRELPVEQADIFSGIAQSTLPVERDDNDMIPVDNLVHISTEIPKNTLAGMGSKASSHIERIIIFYMDKTFSEYLPG